MKKYFKQYKLLSVTYFCSAIFAAFMTVCIAFVYQFLSEAATKGDLNHFIKISLLAIVYFIVEVISDYLPRLTSTKLVQTIMDALRNDLTTRYLDEDILKSMKEPSSSRIAHMTNDLQILETNYLRQIVFSVQVIGVFIIAFISSFIVNGPLASVMILLAFVPFFSPLLSKHVLKGKRSFWQDNKNTYLARYEEFSKNLAYLKISNAAFRFKHKLQITSGKVKDAAVDFEASQGKTFTIIYGLGNIVYSGTWIVGGFFVLNNRATLPELIAMTTLMGTIAGPIQAFSNCYTEITSSKPIADRILSLLKEEQQQQDRDYEVTGIETILLDNITFNYNKVPIIKDISFTFEKGKTYAIKGRSGTGKSTLLEIIMGIRKPKCGSVFVNNRNIASIKQATVFGQIAYIPQKTAIFEGSIQENVALFQNLDDGQFKEAMKKTNLQKYSEDKETYKLDMENKLSGGEERRLDIARGIYTDADVFIFDEPTSGLDLENENLISKIISGIKNKIVIVVTHSENEQFIQSFDYVVELRDAHLQMITTDEATHKKIPVSG